MTSALSDDEKIRVRGARTHNLRNIDLDIPRGKFVVITGPSGSGKSSLAFDTLFAEGQRQYIESLSIYARQFLEQLQRPDVDSVEGLQPVVCIDQRPGNQNPRSTVATTTELYDYLRLLFARLGEITCHQCGQPIRQQSVEQIQDSLMALPEGTKLMVLAPLVRGRKGQHGEIFEQIRKSGQVRARIDGTVHDLDSLPPLDGRKAHTIEGVIDRVIIRPGSQARLAESVELAVKQAEGLVVACHIDPQREQQAKAAGESIDNLWTERLFSTLYACPNCQISLEEIEPRTFSFNSPYGACPQCEGLGYRVAFDPDLVVPDRRKSIDGGAMATWRAGKGQAAAVKNQKAAVADFLQSQTTDLETPLGEWREGLWEKFFQGDDKGFPGLATLLEQELATATDVARKEQLEMFRGQVTCAACKGSRLRPEALGVRLGGKNIDDVCRMSASEAREFVTGLQFFGDDKLIAKPITSELVSRLGFLMKVGLDYLTLARASDSLSGGELQRVRLATGIGSGLAGICYILDEPSIGLHPRDNARLIDALRDLLANDSTVLVVEHDEAMMRACDWLIDIGPGAGSRGGHIVAQGTPPEVIANPSSITGRYLAGTLKIDVPERRKATEERSIVIEGVTTNNLKNITVAFPLGLFIGVTGVSGSGKSSLINETLAPALLRELGQVAPKPGPFTALRGVNEIDKVIEIDQSPIGRSPRSNAATYTGAFDEIRKIFAATKEARQLGFKANRFSFNVPGGRCEECQGQGLKKLEMKFLPDLYVPCPACEGKRFNRQTLAVRFHGKTIADVLDLAIEDALALFANIPAIQHLLASLNDVGLGYLTLGQSSSMLSGGEAQRIKLATELARKDTGKTLYLLDEPTTGLHFDDIRLLLGVLQRLVDRGNTVIVIEHNLDVLKACDWLIDLGPDGGQRGGHLLAAGTPETLAAIDGNETGRFLRDVLTKDHASIS